MHQSLEEAQEVLSEGEQRFERLRRRLGLWAGPAAFALILLLPIRVAAPPGVLAGYFTPGHLLAAVLAWVVIYWLSECIPIPATALLGAFLCVIVGIDSPKAVLAPFADPIVFLFLGSFMLAAAMTRHGLDRRLALSVLGLPGVGASPWRLMAVFGGVALVISMWISNTATTAMLFPIAVGLLRALREAGNAGSGRYATALMLVTAYAASVGGLATPIGTPPNLIGLGHIHELLGVRITFFQWMQLGLPITLATFAYLLWVLRMLHRDPAAEGASGQAMGDYLLQRRAELGPWTRGEANTCGAFAVAVFLWVLPGLLSVAGLDDTAFARFLDTRLPESMVALGAALALFFLPSDRAREEYTLDWATASRIDWGTILLFGGGLALGTLMFTTGLAHAMGHGLTGLVGPVSLWPLTFAAIVLGVVLSETTSNTASATMVVPVVIALAEAVGVNPVPPALGATLGASYGFMLPVSTPPNAIVFGSGMVPIGRMIRAGLLLDLGGVVLVFLGLRILCPLLGLS